jgi:hypothetical protein
MNYDNLQASFINRAREVSPAIDMYLSSKAYLNEIDEDDITDSTVFNLVIGKVVNELGEMGVECVNDEIYTDVKLFTGAMALRELIDHVNLSIFFSNELLHGLVESMLEEVDASIVVSELLLALQSTLPANDLVSSVQSSIYEFKNNDLFITHITTILDSTEERELDPPINELLDNLKAAQLDAGEPTDG